jgi:hypothetical protein
MHEQQQQLLSRRWTAFCGLSVQIHYKYSARFGHRIKVLDQAITPLISRLEVLKKYIYIKNAKLSNYTALHIGCMQLQLLNSTLQDTEYKCYVAPVQHDGAAAHQTS